jgi:hypothetical protein
VEQNATSPAEDAAGDTPEEAVAAPAAAGGAAPAVPDPGWTWPPAGSAAMVGTACFATDEWAPPSTVRHPVVRVGRWTLLYRRAAPRRRARTLGTRLGAGLGAHLGGHLGGHLGSGLGTRLGGVCRQVGELRGHLRGRGSRRAVRRR